MNLTPPVEVQDRLLQIRAASLLCGFARIGDPIMCDESGETHDVYFDGVEDGFDCDCCGDRWYRAYDSEGTDVPMIYSKTNLEEFDSWVIYYDDGLVVRS